MRPAITPEIADLLDGATGGAGSRPAGSVQADLLDATLYVARPPARRARDGEEAVRAASELAPDVVVLDVMMPNKDGVEACREIMESAPDTRVIMLTASTEEDAVIEAVAAGATGYLQKVSGMEQLLATVRDVAAGEMRVPASIVRRVFAAIGAGAEREEKGLGGLTQRDLEILTSFCRGILYARIAEARGVKPVTIVRPGQAVPRLEASGRCGTGCWMTSVAARDGEEAVRAAPPSWRPKRSSSVPWCWTS